MNAKTLNNQISAMGDSLTIKIEDFPQIWSKCHKLSDIDMLFDIDLKISSFNECQFWQSVATNTHWSYTSHWGALRPLKDILKSIQRALNKGATVALRIGVYTYNISK
ncbi:hypothetical protein [Phocoenobacter skyensis]|uniref:Uncharacterized protein n=1 Tax=Phocoenobacter skyensis TaxID=97481 RepID=A0ABT9JKT5_9PAST|nr:hypothetical protein [Pasteurella skyensis]MDP8079548.1 hypothetical protein [Pasteurella skyensis]MDP8085420.1 hypothetical protein [Pasteurella skyensis]